MKSKKGFTLVELLAVIAILAILVILALPNVINMFNQARKQTFVTEAKKIYTEAGKKFVSSSISGKPVKVINSEDDSKLNMTGKKLQYCIILDNSGSVKSMKVSNGEWIASLDGNKQIEDLTTDDLTDGNLDGYNCSSNTPTIPEPLNCTFDGELKQGAEYINGQYTYRYKQENGHSGWQNMSTDGWSVTITDDSTEPVKSDVCTTINNVPIVSMSYMFAWSNALSIDLSNVNTSRVTNMAGMFLGSSVTQLDISNFDTSNVTDMKYMFKDSKAKTIVGLNNLNTSKVTDMSWMFAGSSVTELDISNFDTSNVIDMSALFYNSKLSIIDVSNLDTSNVTNMANMFSYSQATILGLEKLNTSNVKNMQGMFATAKEDKLDLKNFDTSKVTDMSYMFSYCKAVTLDLSGFNTKNVTVMNNMFERSITKTIYVSDKFITNSVSTGNDIFLYSRDLVGGNGTTYDESHIDKTYARIDGGTSSPGYFTLKQ